MRIFTVVLTVVFALVFVVSAVVKLYPIDSLELYVYSMNILSWTVLEIVVRLLVVFELMFGLLLLVSAKKKSLLYVSLVALVFFTFFLLVKFFEGDHENCHCFGELLPLTPGMSIVKNILLIGIAVFLIIKYDGGFSFRLQKVLTYAIIPGVFIFVFTVNAPDSWLQGSFAQRTIENKQFPAQQLSAYVNADLLKGKKIICMFSSGCKYCQMAARKLTGIGQRIDKPVDVVAFFVGSSVAVEAFWEKSKSRKFTHAIIPAHLFFGVSDQYLPTIFFVNNGVVEKKVGYRNLLENDVRAFFESE